MSQHTSNENLWFVQDKRVCYAFTWTSTKRNKRIWIPRLIAFLVNLVGLEAKGSFHISGWWCTIHAFIWINNPASKNNLSIDFKRCSVYNWNSLDGEYMQRASFIHMVVYSNGGESSVCFSHLVLSLFLPSLYSGIRDWQQIRRAKEGKIKEVGSLMMSQLRKWPRKYYFKSIDWSNGKELSMMLL